MSLDKEKSVVTTVIKKRIRIAPAGTTTIGPASLDIVAADNKLYLYQNGRPIGGQTPQNVKTVGGQTIFGVGNIPLPQKVSDLQNDSGFVTNLVNDLVNYYTSEQIDVKLSNLSGYVKKDGDKVLSDNNYDDVSKAIVDGIEAKVTAEAGRAGKAEKANADAIAGLATRVTTAEGTIKAHGADIDDLKTKIVGLTGAMHFVGTSTTDPTLTAGATVEGKDAFASGDVCLFGKKEYVYDGAKWVELGDEGTHLTKATADGYYVAKNAAIAAGAGTKITYDSKGLVIGSTGLSPSDIPNLDTAKIVSGALPDARIESAETWNNKQNKLTAGSGISIENSDDGTAKISCSVGSGKSLFLSSDEPFTSYTLVDNTDMAFTTALTATPTVTIPSDFTGCIAGIEFINKESTASLIIVNNSGIAFSKFRTIVNGTDRTSSRLAKTDDTHYSLTISRSSTIQSVFKTTALGLDIDIREMDYKEDS